MKHLSFLLVIVALITGCAHVVSKDLRDKAEKAVPVSELFENPDTYKGRIFILGGTIVSSANTQEGTYIEVIEKPLECRDRPRYTDLTRGRFIVFYEGYLDTAIFTQGRNVTVAGEIMGTKVRTLGEIDYHYLLLKSRGLYLLRPDYDIPVQLGIGMSHSF